MTDTHETAPTTALAGSLTLAQQLADNVSPMPTDDVVHAMLGLMHDVAAIHALGGVARLDLHNIAELADGQLALADKTAHPPSSNLSAIHRVQPHISSALKVVGEYRVTRDDLEGTKVEDLNAEGDDEAAITKPVYLTGLRSWEIELGHHDEITDVYLLGMVMACLACGIDPNDPKAIERFSFNRSNLFAIAPRLHPVLVSIILEATTLNRHERATDVSELARRLETYRDQPLALDMDRVLAGAQGVPNRRAAVLAHLRDRLFDLSRRNKLIHFRPTQSTVNFTEGSMPIVLRIESVRGDQLCTWKGKFVDEMLSGKKVPLNRWLRFEDQPQLPSSFDRIIQETRRDRNEYGFSSLRLVIAFLNWHNLKEAPNDRICSPLLWLPVEISKAKGVRDQYVLSCAEPVAEYNPALRHMLRQLYNIDLPEEVDLSTVSMTDVHANLMRQIHQSEPGVRLELQERPQIRLILQKAVQRVNRFNRRRGLQRQSVTARTDFSYAHEDYRPLGHALFEKFVKTSPLPQRLAAGGSMRPRRETMVAESEALTYAKGGEDGHKFSWEIDLTQVTLANLNYKKMSLVRDYNELIERPISQPALDQVFSIEPRPFVQDAPPEIAPSDQWTVVPSDATQDTAVALTRTERSFIIQGPPGTGKSQTITNLIADYAGRGKRVLFVCEKRAALDVVFHRLGQAGLDGLACIIHDSQEDKKGFIADLKSHYENWGKTADRLDQVRAVRDRTVSALEQHLEAITAYEKAAGRYGLPDGDVSLRDLVRRAAALPPPPPGMNPEVRERLPDLTAWNAHRALAERTVRNLRDIAGIDSLAAHPFARLSGGLVRGDQPYARLAGLVDEAEAILQRLDRWLDGGSGIVTEDTLLADALEASGLAERMVSTGLAQSPALLDPLSQASAQLHGDLNALSGLVAAHDKAATEAANWTDPLSPADTDAALALARSKESSFFRFLSGAWRDLRKTVQARYDFSRHAVTPPITSVLEALAARHAAAAALHQGKDGLRARLQSSDLDGLLALRGELSSGTHYGVAAEKLLVGARNGSVSVQALALEGHQAPAIRQLFALLEIMVDGTHDMTFGQLSEWLRDAREGLDDLPDLLPLLIDVSQADPAVSMVLRSEARSLTMLEAMIVDEAIARRERTNPDIRRFDAERLISLTRRASAARETLRSQNSDAIRATLHHKFRNHVKISEMSVTQLDNPGRAYKKAFAAGRRELEHEFGKTMRYRSIRELASGDPGVVVGDLKPIWLMSPLSVSDTLPLQSDLFDVVIFDEASQIPTEEAVPALCRSKQVVIVGDEMQLPPTSFFSTALDEDEMQVVAQEDGERISIVLDADSLLSQAARNLPATLLAWHYRSRFEALISFSNAAFYSGQLVTIPDRTRRIAQEPVAPVASSDEEAWGLGVTRLLSAPITTHRMADGIYEGRINVPEARYIAGLVRDLLARNTGQSIGIVAFSEAQQSEIETALDRMAAEDSDFAAALEREYVREDEGQFNGLFVKNLENVQGDERDIILMSVCYAPGRDRKMVMNFGPINQRGGEKRLNVIFSRARRHMAIISTIAPEAITNVHNDGARALRSFLSFAEAQSGGAHDHAQAVLTTLNPEAARTFDVTLPHDPVRDAIAASLRARGHVVDEYVGGASFRCDLAIRNDAGDGYALGILLDRDEAGAVAIEERYVFRPGILRSFGWRVLDLPVAAWLRARTAMIERIELELVRSSWDLADADPYSGVTLPKGAPTASPTSDLSPFPAIAQQEPSTQEVEPAAPPASGGPGLTEFRFSQGTSDKFWRVGVNGCDLIVEFGRVGAKGQRVLKTFEDEDRARREAVKLTLEKTRKGYEEIG